MFLSLSLALLFGSNMQNTNTKDVNMEKESWQKKCYSTFIWLIVLFWYVIYNWNEIEIEISQVADIFLVYWNFWNNMQVIIFYLDDPKLPDQVKQKYFWLSK